ncbi:DUF2070 family protein [Candidatus Micrarchaeota archaeon]|nr:DUF2070 family protein [Candidatus Micrarchaeota archaeon]
MTNINKAVSLTSYLITLPKTQYMLAAIVLLGILFGAIIDFHKPAENMLLDGLMLLSIPAILSSVAVKILIRKMPYRRIVATALAGEVVYLFAYLFSFLIFGINPLWAELAILIGSSLVFVLWYLIARFVFILKYRSVLFAMIQLLFYLFFLGSNQALNVIDEPFFDFALKFYVSGFVLLLAITVFLFIINAPMKKSFGIRSTDALSYFFSQWLYHNKDMEKAFEKVGEPVKTIISIMGFKRKKDTIFFVTPCVHFGPFGNLGGSEFSYLIAEQMDKKYKSRTFVFHGTVTHDLNPVSSAEITKILRAADESIKEAAYSNAKISVSTGSLNECMAQALRINDFAMVSLSRAPKLTEDINFGLGLSLLFEAEKHAKKAMIVDQHNAETGEITSFEPASKVGYGYLMAVRNSLSLKAPSKPLKIGVAAKKPPSEMIGSAGIKVAAFPDYTLVLIDSNGVTPQFRNRIESEVRKIRDVEVGIFTTDTHQINLVRGVVNPLADRKITGVILEAVKEAENDMQEAKFFADTKWFDINVIGARQSIELISTVNSIVSISKFILPLIVLGGLLVIIAVVTRL